MKSQSMVVFQIMSMKMMRLTVIAQRNFLRSSWILAIIPKTLSGDPKRFIHKRDCKAEKLFHNNGSMVSFCLSQVLSKSFPLFGVFNTQSYKELKLNYRKQKDSDDWSKTGLLPLFALALFPAKKDDDDEEGEEKKESQLIIMIKRGILALQRGELNKSEQILHIALKTAQEGQNEQAVTYIFDLLANLAYQREELTKAENLFKEVLKRMFADGMAEDDNAVVEISLKLASVYASRGDYEKAVQGFHFCLGTQEEKIKKVGEKNVDEDTLLLWAMSMDWYARFLLNIQQYELAKKHFIRAYQMSERVHGSEHPQTAVLLNDIGSVCSLEKNYTEAITYLEKAIDAARASQSIDIGSFYVNLGAVYLQQGMLLEAERSCKEGLVLAKKNNNTEGLEEAESCLKQIHLAKAEAKKKQSLN